jgi:hypothetical protein
LDTPKVPEPETPGKVPPNSLQMFMNFVELQMIEMPGNPEVNVFCGEGILNSTQVFPFFDR